MLFKQINAYGKLKQNLGCKLFTSVPQEKSTKESYLKP